MPLNKQGVLSFDLWMDWYIVEVATFCLTHDIPCPVLETVYLDRLVDCRALQYDRVLDHFLEHLTLKEIGEFF